jgi:hypothetical protein
MQFLHWRTKSTDQYRQDGVTKLFQEIRAKQTIEELSPEYQKFAEWLRIEYALCYRHLTDRNFCICADRLVELLRRYTTSFWLKTTRPNCLLRPRGYTLLFPIPS